MHGELLVVAKQITEQRHFFQKQQKFEDDWYANGNVAGLSYSACPFSMLRNCFH